MAIYKITLKNSENNEERTIDFEWDGSMDGLDFYFTEGSMSCDCNRFQLFYNDHNTIFPCGEEVFSLIRISGGEK